jgi:hypothetical protein
MAHSFKFKPSKVKFTKEHRTLDEIHRETIEKFDEMDNRIVQIKQKIYILEKKLNKDNIKNNKNIQLLIEKKIKTLHGEMNNLNTSNDEMDYFEKTRDILLKYYKNENKLETSLNQEILESDSESEENIKSVSTEINEYDDHLMDRLNKLNDINNKSIKEKKTIKKKKTGVDTPQVKSILSFLSNTTDCTETNQETEDNISKIINEKGTLKEQYLSLTDSKYMCEKVKLSPIKICSSCNIEKTLIHSEGIYVCQLCGKFEYVIIESEVPSHKDSLNEKPKYPYKPTI